MASAMLPISELTTLATADDLNGTSDGTQYLSIEGKAVVIIQVANGTAGTAGIDIIEFSTDGGSTWAAATAANLAKVAPGHGGLMSEDGSKAATSGAALNAAGIEPTGSAEFSLAPVQGPCEIRCSRGAAGTGTAWVTGAPSVYAFTIG